MSKRWAVRIGSTAVGLVALATAADVASAQDRWEEQVRTYLQRAANTTSESGFGQSHEPWLGRLRDGQSQEWTVRLTAGTEYRIVGVCDNDCTDVDLKLLRDGDVVEQDIETDDTPVLVITPRATGTYTVRAIMADCDANPCRYGVGMYGRTASSGLRSAVQSEMGPAASESSDRWQEQVRSYLARAARMTSGDGYAETHEPWMGRLRDGQNTEWTIHLTAGTAYRIVGVCDNDCSDFDLRLFNPGGAMIAEDVETDDVPVLTITPRATGTYTVRAIMADCDASPCRYGVGVYGRCAAGRGAPHDAARRRATARGTTRSGG